MNKKRFLLLVISILFLSNVSAFQILDTIATKAGGYDIPIKIKFPKKSVGKSPVYFFVHGGGWNGGTEKTVPPARLHPDANVITDQLGIIYVGLAYRCKGNKATYADAISDLENSVEWFFDNAGRFNADLTRIGFGGASAGSTLSALMAQKYKNCKLYIGAEGMYNLVDHSEELSPFPDQKARKIYGLDTKNKSKKASAFYNLKRKPPSSLLLHGDKDMICHYSQSIKFAEKIKSKGGKARVLLHKNINHTTLNPGIPDVFKSSVLAIATLFIEEFKLDKDINAIKKLLDKRLQNQYPSNQITENKLLGKWRRLNTKIVFQKNGKGYEENIKTGARSAFRYSYSNDAITFVMNSKLQERSFFLRKNNNFIYEFYSQGAKQYRRFNYRKLKS